jgi:TPR repeat protein
MPLCCAEPVSVLRKQILHNRNLPSTNRWDLSLFGFEYLLIRRLMSCHITEHNGDQKNLILRRIIANMPAVLYQYALALVSKGQCATATILLNRAIIRGHLPSFALEAWLLLKGREGVAKDCYRAFWLAEIGTRKGCHYCQGVLACCYLLGDRCRVNEVQSLKLAYESSGKGSSCGQYALGELHSLGRPSTILAINFDQAVALYRLAVAQGLDLAQCSLGKMYQCGYGVAQDLAEALRLYQLAAAQGYPDAMFNVALIHEYGQGIPKNKDEAIRWYRLAQAAGNIKASYALKRLCA